MTPNSWAATPSSEGLITLDCSPFQEFEGARWIELVDAIRTEVCCKEGACLVRSTPADNSGFVTTLADTLQSAIIPDRSSTAYKAPLVELVQARDIGIRSHSGALMYSTTNRHFPCHTDGAHLIVPFEVVILQCVKPDLMGGGLTLIAALDSLLPSLSERSIKVLGRSLFTFQFGLAPILTTTDKAASIRYNRAEIEHCASVSGAVLSAQSIAAMDALDESINLTMQTVALEAGDCLVLNNRAMLHGRTAFDRRAGRLLRRVRLGGDASSRR